MNFPGAVATIETFPKVAQTTSATTSAIRVPATQRLIGDGGVSWISRSGGRNSRSSGVSSRPRVSGLTNFNLGDSGGESDVAAGGANRLGDSMSDSGSLLGEEVVIDAGARQELRMASLLHQLPPIEHQDSVRVP
jgi:hypothetical protein